MGKAPTNNYADCPSLRIPTHMLDIAVPDVQLDSPCIEALIRQIDPASMPQYVRMHRKSELSFFARALAIIFLIADGVSGPLCSVTNT